MSYGGRGVAKQDGKVYFIPQALPGQVVDAVITVDKGRFAECELMAVVERAEAEVSPACEVFGQCGGCQWQRAPIAAQRQWKKTFIEDALTRIAKLDSEDFRVSMSDVGEAYDYRNRIQLRGRIDSAGQVKVGFFAAKSRELVTFDTCAIADPRLAKLTCFLNMARVVSGSESKFRVELQVVQAAPTADAGYGISAVFHGVGGVSPALKQLMMQVRDQPEVIWAWEEGRVPEQPWLLEHIDGIDHYTLPGQFAQVNRALNRQLVDAVVTGLTQLLPPQEGQAPLKILDLFCGSGNIALALLQRGMFVHGVEINPTAIELARHAVQQNKLERLASFTAEPVHQFLAWLDTDLAHYHAAVVDPPRKGMSECVEALLEHGPPVVAYISCDPNSMARDLARLQARYQVVQVMGFDFFPQTYHVETLVLLQARA